MKTIETDIEKITKKLEEEGCRVLTEEELRLRVNGGWGSRSGEKALPVEALHLLAAVVLEVMEVLVVAGTLQRIALAAQRKAVLEERQRLLLARRSQTL